MANRRRHVLSEREKQLLEQSVDEVRELKGETLVHASGELCEHATILISGFAIRIIADDTSRSIVGLHVPGDMVDLQGFVMKRLDYDIGVVGAAKIGIIRHKLLQQMIAREPQLAKLLWCAACLDGAMHREWIAKLARHRATGRVAHIIAELCHRLRMVGLGSPQGFVMPFTQRHLANLCGLSQVQINRSLRDLREDGVVTIRRNLIRIDNGERLEKIARFDPAYLYGEGPP
ncbi:helix-turn-helix domain-containing protein [Altererythrobacter aurantiacus]|uniref:Helix-turn-helix domain-containing protein n=1 Tax=Parapontixanthobacter aurantiacus TaxID=1463599 RepID=A0A844ZFI7_9SPHN|nr:Crp/Fnr family transcriptional regulator [Parapontixanthobacter aurantiacus]MXO86012.1 helix-turn-helix domain-containing protein [Parapontixanthobacter aurantiacus]